MILEETTSERPGASAYCFNKSSHEFQVHIWWEFTSQLRMYLTRAT